MSQTRPRVLFLGGIGRSGTTLLERTIAEAEGVTALGEVMFLWERGVRRNELCGCGAAFHDCAFWTAVGERGFGGWDRVDTARIAVLKDRVDRAKMVALHRSRLASRVRAEVAEYASYFVRLYRAAAELTGDLLVDSSKQVSLASAVATTETVDLRVLHCVRDSRGVAYSWTQMVERPEATDGELLMTRYAPSRLSAYWMLHNAELDVLGRAMPIRRLRYEDFVARPAPELRGVLDFAGLPEASTSHVSGNVVRLAASHTSAGNPMRFRIGDVELRADQRWRSEMPAFQRRLVTTLTAPLLWRYGYLDR